MAFLGNVTNYFHNRIFSNFFRTSNLTDLTRKLKMHAKSSDNQHDHDHRLLDAAKDLASAFKELLTSLNPKENVMPLFSLIVFLRAHYFHYCVNPIKNIYITFFMSLNNYLVESQWSYYQCKQYQSCIYKNQWGSS